MCSGSFGYDVFPSCPVTAPVTFLWPESSSSSEAPREPLKGGREDGGGFVSEGEKDGSVPINRPLKGAERTDGRQTFITRE